MSAEVSPAELLRQLARRVQERLPAGWLAEAREPVVVADRRADAIIDLTAPDGTSAVIVVEYKPTLVRRDLSSLLDRLTAYVELLPVPAVPMVGARYLASSVRESLERQGVSYVDATGNMHLALDRPALFLRDRGADRDPQRGPGRPRGSLKGVPAARVVRTLADMKPPFTIPDLVSMSGASTGATYRIVDYIEQEQLLERVPRGQITEVRWRRLLERWSDDYGFQRNNAVGNYLQPRGLLALADALAEQRELRYALTGSLAAQQFAPFAPARLAMLYVESREETAERLDLRPVDSGGNVLLAAGEFDVVFDRARMMDGIRYAAPSQVAVDLLTGPGRSPAEANAILDWMEDNEAQWRQ